jgi:DNA-binding winged helix-turn-helix (wHTH) protein/Tol biopolymer transport system component
LVSFAFDPFRLEPATRRLLRNGEPLPLTPKAFDTLLVLVQNRERVVEKSEVMRLVWPDTVVEEANLAQHVFTLRKALGDSPDGARFIATIPKRGYRFVAEVRELPNGGGPAATALPAAAIPTAAGPRLRRWGRATGLALAAMAVAAIGYEVGRGRAQEDAPPSVQRLTFRRGTLRGARFAPDGRKVVYSATWDGQASQVFLGSPDHPEAMPIGAAGTDLLAISPSNQLAVALRTSPLNSMMGDRATLAEMPLTGGAPRERLENVLYADWSPDGQTLAVVREIAKSRKRLEYPIGTVLHETIPSDCILYPRVSPDGRRVAFFECNKPGGPSYLSVVDLQGRKQRLVAARILGGLAWSPSGEEVWYTGGTNDFFPELRGVSLSGRERLVARLPGRLEDVARDGRVLITRGTPTSGMAGRAPGDPAERDLSWLQGSSAVDLTDDGRHLLFGEYFEGGGVHGRIYLRQTDGSPAVQLAEGYPGCLSPDGQWAVIRREGARTLSLIPTGAGEGRDLPRTDFDVYSAAFFPDGRRLLLGGQAPGRSGRLYVQDLETGTTRAITPEMTGAGVVSPDGTRVATIGHDGHFLYPVDGRERRPCPGPEEEEWPIQWSADGRHVYVHKQGTFPVRVTRIELSTGRREPWKELAPADPAGVTFVQPILTRDARAYAYTYYRYLSDLYLVTGVR